MERMIPKGLEPELVYEIFEEISRIPRPSGHEEEISNWLVAFADKEAKGVPVHTGLECGIIAKNIGRKVDMISIGSEIKESHRPGEWFSISSAERYWKLLLEVLNRL